MQHTHTSPTGVCAPRKGKVEKIKGFTLSLPLRTDSSLCPELTRSVHRTLTYGHAKCPRILLYRQSNVPRSLVRRESVVHKSTLLVQYTLRTLTCESALLRKKSFFWRQDLLISLARDTNNGVSRRCRRRLERKQEGRRERGKSKRKERGGRKSRRPRKSKRTQRRGGGRRKSNPGHRSRQTSPRRQPRRRRCSRV